MVNTEEELKKVNESTNAKFEALQSKEVNLAVIPKRTRVSLKQNAKGMYQADMTIEDYNKTNKEMVNELIDLKKKVESAIITAD